MIGQLDQLGHQLLQRAHRLEMDQQQHQHDDGQADHQQQQILALQGTALGGDLPLLAHQLLLLLHQRPFHLSGDATGYRVKALSRLLHQAVARFAPPLEVGIDHLFAHLELAGEQRSEGALQLWQGAEQLAGGLRVLFRRGDGVLLSRDGCIGQKLLHLGGVIAQLLQGNLPVGAGNQLFRQLPEPIGQGAAPDTPQHHGKQDNQARAQQQMADREVAKQCKHGEPSETY